MLPLGNIIRKYGISFHCYADDTQLYISTRPDETSKLSKLTECVKNIKDCMTNNFLLLNSDKTDILLIGPKNSIQNLLHLPDTFIQSDIQCIQVIHILSVHVFHGNQTHNLCAANAML